MAFGLQLLRHASRITLGLALLSAAAWPMEPAAAATSLRKSISNWVDCNGGNSDDTTGAKKAFEAAKKDAFTLVIDCAVHLRSGTAVDRGIFIDTGTTVEFTGAGKFYIDNLFHPAFTLANVNAVKLTNWNVEWDGIMPINPDIGGYILNGASVKTSGKGQPAGGYNDHVLSPWLTANRGIEFDLSKGWNQAIWVGSVNTGGVFYITGNTYNIVMSGLHLYVPQDVPASHFIPMAFSFSANWLSRQTVNLLTPHTTKYVAIPHDLTFSDITLDGTLMGFQGNVSDVLFENITSLRYADLQDGSGGNVGGIGKWFPPPHLFYLNYDYDGDKGLHNKNIHIEDVNDLGPRLGVARDKAGGNSGYALSLKLGCDDCSVNNYVSNRPDGFMDVLPSTNLDVTNVTATFDSHFLNDIYPPGIRFPMTGYSHVAFEHLTFEDSTEYPVRGAIGHAPIASNKSITFADTQVNYKYWSGADLPLPIIGGETNNVALNFTMSWQKMNVAHLQRNTVTTILQASPTTLKAGQTTLLKWNSREATACVPSGAWSGSIRGSGSLAIKLAAKGNHDFTLKCRNATTSSTTTVRVIAQ